MAKLLALFGIAAVLAVLMLSGCTQQPYTPSGGTPSGNTPSGSVNKAAEDAAASALQAELDQAVANMTETDIESAMATQ